MQCMPCAVFIEVSGCILTNLIRIRGNQHTATHVRKSPLVTRAAQGRHNRSTSARPRVAAFPGSSNRGTATRSASEKKKKTERETSSATTRRAGVAGISDYGSFCGTTNPHRSARDSIIVTPYISLLWLAVAPPGSTCRRCA